VQREQDNSVFAGVGQIRMSIFFKPTLSNEITPRDARVKARKPTYTRHAPVTQSRELTAIQLERLMQRAHGQFRVLLVDQHRNLDLGRRDHLDVDALF
jgi:hypothetical protein